MYVLEELYLNSYIVDLSGIIVADGIKKNCYLINDNLNITRNAKGVLLVTFF